MSLMIEALSQSLQTGYIDKLHHSDKSYLPHLLLNDKVSGLKVLSTIESELKKCDEFWFSVAFLTTSGVATLINTLVELQNKNVKGKILVSQYLNFTEPKALERLLQFKNIELKIVVDGNFHSKGYLFKKGDFYNLIVGSSNLTASALCSNKELNLKISATANSHIITTTIEKFQKEFESAVIVDANFITNYISVFEAQKARQKAINENYLFANVILPNAMQNAALENISNLRKKNCNKALLISATGTGKTFLSAFDVKSFNPEKFLFIVHRENIAKAAMTSYKRIFGTSKKMGLYTGNSKETEADFIFSTIQTISKEAHHKQFKPEYFEYIVIDETHRAGATSYQEILNYFKPKFLLGMTATPERTDGLDVFKLFDYQIAYEIRLHQALDEDMLSPFHYYGVTDITVDNAILEEKSDFKLLTASERINHIIKYANFYGCDSEKVRGLIFCSRIEESKELSNAFNERGFKTIALTGDNSEFERAAAIDDLESGKLDYIFTVDIFNEGIDIPKVNQIIMLRPTQSAIIFVQQLGRGLRKSDEKSYLTVIDFIGNYSNNYLVPIALYGDNTYNKDKLRKLISSGSSELPGTSTVNFDKITKDRIFKAIDTATMDLKKDLVNDYNLLKYKIGRIPMMVDFLEHGSRDAKLFVDKAKSYFNFVHSVEKDNTMAMSKDEIKLLELFANDINNSKRVEESFLLKMLLVNKKVSKSEFKKAIESTYGYSVNDKTIESTINNLNFEFITENLDGKLISVASKYHFEIIKIDEEQITLQGSFETFTNNQLFIKFLSDNVEYAIQNFNKNFDLGKFHDGFLLYQKYSRKDVIRILNWSKNPVAQNIGGYIVSADQTNCPIFVNYHKEDHISSSTKYEDHFINNYEFAWMTKSNRTLQSREVQLIKNHQNNFRMPLFVKKNNDEGLEFYYMGDMSPVEESFEQTTMLNDSGKNVSVVKINFVMKVPVAEPMFNYITDNNKI